MYYPLKNFSKIQITGKALNNNGKIESVYILIVQTVLSVRSVGVGQNDKNVF